MRYYQYPETGELVRFNLSMMEWTELRCDSTTQFDTRWVPVEVTSDQAKHLTHVTHEEANRHYAEVRQANASKRGEAFMRKAFPRGRTL